GRQSPGARRRPMWIKVKRGWELPERAATPEHVYEDRRRLIKAAAAGSILLAGGAVLAPGGDADDAPAGPSGQLYPAKRNDKYKLDRAITPEEIVTNYNNYYEFGSSKDIAGAAKKLPLRPWSVTIDGMVEVPMTIAIDDLLAKVPLEERLYRHRC